MSKMYIPGQGWGGSGAKSFSDLSGQLSATQVPDAELSIAKTNGLQTALDGKSATTHNHDAAYSAIGHDHSGTYAPTAHSHAISDSTGLQTALDGKAASSHAHAVSDITATGTPSSSTYLRGDGSWQTPSGGGLSPSLVRCTGISAKGATNTNVLQLATVAETVGTGIAVTSDATNGGYITVSANGVYHVSISLYNTTGSFQNVFVKRNASLVNNAGATDTDLIRIGSITTGYVNGASLSVYLTTSDKLYFTAPFTPDNTYPLFNQMVITRIS